MLYHDEFKKKKATNYRIRLSSLVMVRNQLPAQLVNLLRCHARREFFVLKLQYFFSFNYI